MSLILAVDRDRRQATQLASLLRRLKADLVQTATAAEALEALAGRVPDLILTSSLISPKEDGVLAKHLRQLGDLAAHVQTLTIPVLKSSRPRRSKGGVLSKLRRDNSMASAAQAGCDPEVFAEEVGLYLARAAEERQMRAAREAAASVSAQPLDPVDLVADETPDVASEFADVIVDSPQAIVEAGADVESPMEILDPLVDATEEPTEATVSHVDLAAVEMAATHLHSPDVAYSAAVEDALAAMNETEDGLEDVTLEAARPVGPSVEAETSLEAVTDWIEVGRALRDFEDVTDIAAPEETSLVLAEASAEDGCDEAIHLTAAADEEPAIAVPIERLMALFADLQPRSIEVMAVPAIVSSVPLTKDETPLVAATKISEPEPLVASATAEPVERVATDRETTAQSLATEAPAPKPVLDEEALVQIGEAAWKATFRAAFLKDLGLGADRTEASSEKEDSKIDSSKARTPQPPEDRESGESPAEQIASAARKENRSKKKPARQKKAPIQDEWGLFDPEQCGFSALVDKLDKVTDSPEEQPKPGTRVRVITY